MARKAVITVLGTPQEIEGRWDELRPPYIDGVDAAVSFEEAPGDRGTEVHVDLEHETTGGKLGEAILKLTGKEPLSKAKDDLRRFKARVETGIVPRSEGSPEGELAERKLKQRPAQPLAESELEQAGV